ncbi:MAG: hypothetical protein GF317_12865 [Candidatus Lokiarchaeota archaeon]|nr:hypothetical protein [Candidatus Lokiarchaeota archaeon]MBD3200532.1 hypothetical protein [Candidatus Lokiarchaeota archaeon]
MPKCPYCKKELELYLEIKPTEITDKYKRDALQAYESFIEIQSEAAPFGGGMMKKFAKYSLKWVARYFEKIGAVPVVFQSCKNCDSVIDTEIVLSLTSFQNRSS